MKCKHCGAPLDLSLDTCLYCRNKITFDNKFSKQERNIRIALSGFVFAIGMLAISILISLYLSPTQKLKTAINEFKYLENLKINTSTSIIDSENNSRNINSNILYTNIADTISLNINIESSKYNNNIELYSIIDTNETSVYIKSSKVDIFGKTKSEDDKWLVNISNAFSISLFNNVDKFNYKYKENGNKKFEHNLSNSELNIFKAEIKSLNLDNFKLLDDELNIDNVKDMIISIYLTDLNEITELDFVLTTEDNKKIVIKSQIFKSNDNVSVPVEALSTIDKLETYIENNKF